MQLRLGVAPGGPADETPGDPPDRDGAVLVLQHAACEGPGRIADALDAIGLPFRVVHAGDGEPVPELAAQ